MGSEVFIISSGMGLAGFSFVAHGVRHGHMKVKSVVPVERRTLVLYAHVSNRS